MDIEQKDTKGINSVRESSSANPEVSLSWHGIRFSSVMYPASEDGRLSQVAVAFRAAPLTKRGAHDQFSSFRPIR